MTDPNTHHVPGWGDATRWLTLATLCQQVADGYTCTREELRRAVDAVTDKGVVVFGVLNRQNPCLKLRQEATLAGARVDPVRLKATAEAVLAAYYDWEAGQ